ncbi:MAG: reverse transcriptase family protein [Zoogloeaceae bacterium]|nr:reverse transcriptase family protein [Zoogloeaceae bacterium]
MPEPRAPAARDVQAPHDRLESALLFLCRRFSALVIVDDFPDSLPPTKNIRKVAVALARAFLAGDRSPAALRERGIRALGRSWRWLNPLILRLRSELATESAWQVGQPETLVDLMLAFPPFLAAFESHEAVPQIRGHFPFHVPMGMPPAALAGLTLPPLATPGDLADWLELSPALLDWFANVQGRDMGARGATPTPKLAHYHSRWLAKPGGGARLIEAPKRELRAIQRRILREILDRVPMHAAAYGCARGRSVVDNAALHVGSPLLLKLDLRDFFASIPGARVHALFRTLGYPRDTARYLTGLTTHCTPARIVRAAPQEEYPSPEERRRHQNWARQFMERHLPQGAPTSPALANLCAWRLDARLSGAARSCRARYSRYVDDLVFSCADGDPARGRRMVNMMQDIILEEGFSPNWRKTRIIPSSASQRVTGLVVNQRPNLPRREYDTLKAILTNCHRHGAASQNRENAPDFRARLLGRIGWFSQVNPERGARLMALFARIDWNDN